MNMAMLNLSFSFFCLFLLSSTSSGILKFTHAQADVGQATWCVAKPSVPIAQLMANIEYVCNNQQLDCTDIQPGGPCFETNDLGNHASVAMNLYYQYAGKQDLSCDFAGTGVLAITDPSYGDCEYAYVA